MILILGLSHSSKLTSCCSFLPSCLCSSWSCNLECSCPCNFAMPTPESSLKCDETFLFPIWSSANNLVKETCNLWGSTSSWKPSLLSLSLQVFPLCSHRPAPSASMVTDQRQIQGLDDEQSSLHRGLEQKISEPRWLYRGDYSMVLDGLEVACGKVWSDGET